jgi:hypothetical protein
MLTISVRSMAGFVINDGSAVPVPARAGTRPLIVNEGDDADGIRADLAKRKN